MSPSHLVRALLLASLTAAIAAQTLDVSHAVDPIAKTTSFRFDVVGPAGGTCHLLASTGLTGGLSLSFGTFHLDPTMLVTLAVIPLNSKGIGTRTISFPSASVPSLRADVQAVCIGPGGASISNYAIVAHHASTTLAETMAARYDALTDHLRVGGKGKPGDLIEVFRIRPGIGRYRLGSFVVPPAPTMFSFGAAAIGFLPGDQIEVVALGLYKLMILQ